MPYCDHCGERYREVWKAGRLRPLLYSDNSLHACQGSRKERAEKMKNNHGGNWGKNRKGRKFKKPTLGKPVHARRWTAADEANKEANARLRFLLGGA